MYLENFSKLRIIISILLILSGFLLAFIGYNEKEIVAEGKDIAYATSSAFPKITASTATFSDIIEVEVYYNKIARIGRTEIIKLTLSDYTQHKPTMVEIRGDLVPLDQVISPNKITDAKISLSASAFRFDERSSG